MEFDYRAIDRRQMVVDYRAIDRLVETLNLWLDSIHPSDVGRRDESDVAIKIIISISCVRTYTQIHIGL